MSPLRVGSILRHFGSSLVVLLALASVARAQQAAPPPAYFAVVEGEATLEREGEIVPATQNMPFVQGDRLRTGNGRVEIVFPDGSAIEVAENSEVEAVSPTRVRLIAGTMDHLQRQTTPSTSSTYLPQDLDGYGSTLDQNGWWQYDAPYGYVWYPTVAADWRPYYYGYWSPVRSYGWTWVGLDTWAWPTHHYGRWGYSRNRWFWIPGRTWAPAWVSWAGAPDYVSWCPLGFDGRPVFALSVGHSNTWAGWTVLPRGNFGVHGYYAHRNAVEPRRIPANTPFIVRNTPPVPAMAARRGIDAGRAASTGIAVPRAGHESVVGSRQSVVGGRQSVVGRGQSVVGGRDAVAGNREAAIGRRPSGVDGRESGVALSPTRDRGLPATHYGIAVPRNGTPDRQTAPSTSQPPTNGYRVVPPDARLPTADSRPSPPAYRSPNEYRIQRMPSRVLTPAVPSPPPPAATAPGGGSPAPPQMAVPRPAVPSARPAPAGPPPQAAPQAAPPARSGPHSGAGAQGEGRGQAQQGRGRPR